MRQFIFLFQTSKINSTNRFNISSIQTKWNRRYYGVILIFMIWIMRIEIGFPNQIWVTNNLKNTILIMDNSWIQIFNVRGNNLSKYDLYHTYNYLVSLKGKTTHNTFILKE